MENKTEKDSQFKLKETGIERTVVKGYKAVENAVVGTYDKIENAVVGTYDKVEKAFVDTFLETKDQKEKK